MGHLAREQTFTFQHEPTVYIYFRFGLLWREGLKMQVSCNYFVTQVPGLPVPLLLPCLTISSFTMSITWMQDIKHTVRRPVFGKASWIGWLRTKQNITLTFHSQYNNWPEVGHFIQHKAVLLLPSCQILHKVLQNKGSTPEKTEIYPSFLSSLVTFES